MSHNDRLRRLRDTLQLSAREIALIFGTTEWSVQAWLHDRRNMRSEFYATLLRLECDNLAQLAPKLRPDTIRLFNAGRRRRA